MNKGTETAPCSLRPRRNLANCAAKKRGFRPAATVLDFKPTQRPEQVGDERPQQLEDRKHRTG